MREEVRDGGEEEEGEPNMDSSLLLVPLLLLAPARPKPLSRLLSLPGNPIRPPTPPPLHRTALPPLMATPLLLLLGPLWLTYALAAAAAAADGAAVILCKG